MQSCIIIVSWRPKQIFDLCWWLMEITVFLFYSTQVLTIAAHAKRGPAFPVVLLVQFMFEDGPQFDPVLEPAPPSSMYSCSMMALLIMLDKSPGLNEIFESVYV